MNRFAYLSQPSQITAAYKTCHQRQCWRGLQEDFCLAQGSPAFAKKASPVSSFSSLLPCCCPTHPTAIATAKLTLTQTWSPHWAFWNLIGCFLYYTTLSVMAVPHQFRTGNLIFWLYVILTLSLYLSHVYMHMHMLLLLFWF